MLEVKNYDDLPLILTVEQMGEVLGISRVLAYETVNRQDFPKLILGHRRIAIPKESFINWIKQQTDATV